VSIRWGSSTTYCIRQATTPKPGRWERAHLMHGPLHGVARGHPRSPPQPRSPVIHPRVCDPPHLKARPFPGRPGPGRPSASVRAGPARLRPGPPLSSAPARC
jgi:hypothetical protein